MSTTEERVTRLEATLEHLATKADVEKVRTDVANVQTAVEKVKTSLLHWFIGTLLTTVLTTLIIAAAVFRPS